MAQVHRLRQRLNAVLAAFDEAGTDPPALGGGDGGDGSQGDLPAFDRLVRMVVAESGLAGTVASDGEAGDVESDGDGAAASKRDVKRKRDDGSESAGAMSPPRTVATDGGRGSPVGSSPRLSQVFTRRRNPADRFVSSQGSDGHGPPQDSVGGKGVVVSHSQPLPALAGSDAEAAADGVVSAASLRSPPREASMARLLDLRERIASARKPVAAVTRLPAPGYVSSFFLFCFFARSSDRLIASLHRFRLSAVSFNSTWRSDGAGDDSQSLGGLGPTQETLAGPSDLATAGDHANAAAPDGDGDDAADDDDDDGIFRRKSSHVASLDLEPNLPQPSFPSGASFASLDASERSPSPPPIRPPPTFGLSRTRSKTGAQTTADAVVDAASPPIDPVVEGNASLVSPSGIAAAGDDEPGVDAAAGPADVALCAKLDDALEQVASLHRMLTGTRQDRDGLRVKAVAAEKARDALAAEYAVVFCCVCCWLCLAHFLFGFIFTHDTPTPPSLGRLAGVRSALAATEATLSGLHHKQVAAEKRQAAAVAALESELAQARTLSDSTEGLNAR